MDGMASSLLGSESYVVNNGLERYLFVHVLDDACRYFPRKIMRRANRVPASGGALVIKGSRSTTDDS